MRQVPWPQPAALSNIIIKIANTHSTHIDQAKAECELAHMAVHVVLVLIPRSIWIVVRKMKPSRGGPTQKLPIN
ncbi:hypothetical protein AS026_26760 [Rhizobium altiplani]|uniref:Uncharacterized protein n=1 Tax=Rhizobium altiplani TaxID=1864509 RepID=A0A109J0P6_9HYPH|nr:hypothetical protein AS026_26760 [Rhizobium altiplani]